METIYTNVAIQKTVIDTPVKNITLLVKGSGFKLIASSFTIPKLTLNLKKATKKKANNYFFTTKKLHKTVQLKLNSGIELIKIQRDTIPLKMGTLQSKKIPLKTNLELTFQLGHDLATPIKITPSHVLISGEASLIDKITSLNLKKIKLENISESTTLKATIEIPKKLRIETSSAKINIIVDKFTEGEIEIPISIKNAPKNINIFPKKVKIIYKVGLKNFNKINANLFKIECDYKQVIMNGTTYLTPKLMKFPDSITLIRIVPKKIDFLIHK
ncbi:CdaR family protein [Tenacibaculum salmonis]|uniref:CdaR family protein n=1 Tax=Tenacibaculum sp. P3-BQ1 TaxID=3232310 RepID=UPI0034DE2ABB